MPVIRSSTYAPSGGGNFLPRSQRRVTFTATVDMGNLTTLDMRMPGHMRTALTFRLGVVARAVVMKAAESLYPGHGVDTGLMQHTLIATLVRGLEREEYVAYDLMSKEATYWMWVEWGHMTRAGNWWEGYHFFRDAIAASEPQIRQAVREAWADSVIALAGEAAVSEATRVALGRTMDLRTVRGGQAIAALRLSGL